MEQNMLTTIYNGLNSSLEKQAKALPDNFNKQRFVQNCMTVLQDGKADFSKCEPRTVVRTLMKASFLNLDFFNGECYAIPYGNNCQFQTDYKGEIKLCKRYSSNPIKDIYAKLVREGDVFEEEINNGAQTVNFRPKPFNDGKIIGAFAVIVYKDGSMIYDTMSVNEMDKTRQNFSKAANSKAWKETPGEMYKKTVLRRICKLVDLNFDTAEQCEAFKDGGDLDLNKTPEPANATHHEDELDPFKKNDNVIDVQASEIRDAQEKEEVNK